MLSELAGFTVTRALPDKVLMGIASGAYKVYGGVVRDSSGKIVSHLINASNPLNLSTMFPPLNMAISSINTFQLSRIGANISQLLTLAKGTMALSGLTLGVSAVGFYFLNQKLKKVDERLRNLAKDVKKIRVFLELQERARLETALRNLKGINQGNDKNVRRELLLSAKQSLSEIHYKYRQLLIEANDIKDVLPVEEYYTITSLGHALCTSELDMYDPAYLDLQESYEIWRKATNKITENLIIKDNPERFLHARYVEYVETDALIDWLDFAYKSNKGTQWIDWLRLKNFWNIPWKSKDLSVEEKMQIEVMKKIVARNRVLEGHVIQYKYFSEIQQRPSSVQQFIENIPIDKNVDDCFILISNDFKQKT